MMRMAPPLHVARDAPHAIVMNNCGDTGRVRGTEH